MKLPISFLFVLVAFPCVLLGENESESEPGKTYELVFPEIEPTLLTLATGKENVAKLLYRLPDNFSPEKKYPVFVFLTGGTGDGMEKKGLGRAVAITEVRITSPLLCPCFDEEKNWRKTNSSEVC